MLLHLKISYFQGMQFLFPAVWRWFRYHHTFEKHACQILSTDRVLLTGLGGEGRVVVEYHVLSYSWEIIIGMISKAQDPGKKKTTPFWWFLFCLKCPWQWWKWLFSWKDFGGRFPICTYQFHFLARINPQWFSELRWLWSNVPWWVACELIFFSDRFPH